MNCPSGSLFMALIFKSILSDMSVATLAFFFFSCPFTRDIFYNPSFLICVSLLFRARSFVDSICVGHDSHPFSYSMSFD